MLHDQKDRSAVITALLKKINTRDLKITVLERELLTLKLELASAKKPEPWFNKADLLIVSLVIIISSVSSIFALEWFHPT